MAKKYRKDRIEQSDPYTKFQYGCRIDQTNGSNVKVPLNITPTFMANETLKGVHEANFTKLKKEAFKDIQFYINKTFDALSLVLFLPVLKNG